MAEQRAIAFDLSDPFVDGEVMRVPMFDHVKRGQAKALEYGFTLIEMLISMSMGLVIIGGITMVFITNSNVSRVMSSQTEIMGDLYLASHVMQSGLRGSLATTAPNPSFPVDLGAGGRKPASICSAPNDKTVSKPANYPTSFPSYPYWDATSKTLTYQDIDGNTGIIQYQRTASDRIYWLKPDPCVYRFQELIRDMDVTAGMNVTITAGVVDVVLQAAYKNEQKQSKTLSLSFKTWPRN